VSPHKLPVMFVDPAETPVASPVLLIVATAGVCEFQVMAFVTVFELTVPVNCWVVPALIVAFGGATVTFDEVSAVPVMVTCALPRTLLAMADTVALPGPIATPVLLPFMQSMLVAEEVQLAWVVTSWLPPDEVVQVAVNCGTWPVVRL
jgi:hypothetical protein